MPNGSNWSLYAWAALASLAGALMSLSARPFEKMSRWQIALALLGSASFGFFVGPLVAQTAFPDGREDMRVMGAVLFVMSSASHVFFPWVVKWLGRFLGVTTNGTNEEQKP